MRIDSAHRTDAIIDINDVWREQRNKRDRCCCKSDDVMFVGQPPQQTSSQATTDLLTEVMKEGVIDSDL